MKKFNLVLRHSEDLEAKNEEDAMMKYFQSITDGNTDLANFISSNLKVRQAFLASELKENALEKVLEKYSDINDYNWWNDDDTPHEDMKELGLEIDMSKMSFELESRYRQLYFSKDGIKIVDLSKFLKRIKKDLSLSKKVVDAMSNGEIELYFDIQYFGGGDGRSYLKYSDYTEKTITDSLKIDLDEALQEWFDDNVINHLLKYFQNNYDYLTSKEAIIETLDANEHQFTEDGQPL